MNFLKHCLLGEIAVYLLHTFNLLMLIFNFLFKDCFGMQIVMENCEISLAETLYKEHTLVSVFG